MFLELLGFLGLQACQIFSDQSAHQLWVRLKRLKAAILSHLALNDAVIELSGLDLVASGAPRFCLDSRVGAWLKPA